jgi:hypothetical protein
MDLRGNDRGLVALIDDELMMVINEMFDVADFNLFSG